MNENNVGATIKLLRQSRSLSQGELGKIVGFSARTVSDWENGNTEPNISAIKALVKFFEISYEEFFGDI